jgi:hypothetical protein
MDDMGTPGPNHPAHKGLKPDNNVTQLPGMGMRRLRMFKNSIMDHVLGPEQVHYNENQNEYDDDPFVETMPPERAARFQEHLNSLMEKDRTGHLNDGIADGAPDAKVISMGKFKEDKANKELMGKQYE